MLPSEVFLHLRLQFVRVLGLILTETRRGTACRSHLGVEEHVLEQAVRSLQIEGIESDAEFYRAFKAATGAERRTKRRGAQGLRERRAQLLEERL